MASVTNTAFMDEACIAAKYSPDLKIICETLLGLTLTNDPLPVSIIYAGSLLRRQLDQRFKNFPLLHDLRNSAAMLNREARQSATNGLRAEAIASRLRALKIHHYLVHLMIQHFIRIGRLQ